MFDEIINFTIYDAEVTVHRHKRHEKPSEPVKIQRRASAARIMPEFSHIQLDELKRLGCLGKGGYGKVDLVQYKNKELFALKYLKKYDIVQCQQQKHVFNEREVMFSCDSPFIVKYAQSSTFDKIHLKQNIPRDTVSTVAIPRKLFTFDIP